MDAAWASAFRMTALDMVLTDPHYRGALSAPATAVTGAAQHAAMFVDPGSTERFLPAPTAAEREEYDVCMNALRACNDTWADKFEAAWEQQKQGKRPWWRKSVLESVRTRLAYRIRHRTKS